MIPLPSSSVFGRKALQSKFRVQLVEFIGPKIADQHKS